MSIKDKIFTFWGMMDVFAIGSYLFFSVKMGNLPFWSDIRHFYVNLSFMQVKGADYLLLQCVFFIYLMLMVSLFYSGWCFLKKKQIGILFISLQEVMRFFSLSCSVAFFPLILRIMRIEDALVAFILFLLSETLKIGSLQWLRKQKG
ncbi:hypothetical protein KXR87_20845 [Yokenella regensburgei]|uniref:hypothetical protein n=1 Tax=Yokenella regensburgei TaxID=158877 RepID=UPI003F17E429